MYRPRLTSAALSRSRRRFVQGLAGGALAVVSARHFGWAAAADPAAAGNAGAVLSGTEFNLEIGTLAVNFTGQPGIATVVNGRLPAPLLRWREGDAVTTRYEQTMTLPDTVDTEKVSATFRHGLLELTLPLKETLKPRRIEISTEASKQLPNAA